MPLDLTSLKQSIFSLERAITIARHTLVGGIDTDLEKVIQAGVIQNFEFTYELCWKFMTRWLEKNLGSSNIDGVSRKELFRIAAEHHLILDVTTWFLYHVARNKTSHTYNENTANDVYTTALEFIVDAKHLLKQIESKND